MEKKERELSCAVCFEPFSLTERIPKMLHCFHTFCSKCLEALLKDDSSRIICPTCRRETIATTKVDGFPPNYTLIEFLESLQPEQPRTSLTEDVSGHCDFCDDGECFQKYYCVDCIQSMCDKAYRFHGRSSASRNHRVSTMEEKKNNIENKITTFVMAPVSCKLHPGEVRFYCSDPKCKKLICPDCFLQHNGHNIKSIQTAYEEQKENIIGLLIEIKKKENYIKMSQVKLKIKFKN